MKAGKLIFIVKKLPAIEKLQSIPILTVTRLNPEEEVIQCNVKDVVPLNAVGGKGILKYGDGAAMSDSSVKDAPVTDPEGGKVIGTFAADTTRPFASTCT